jgi:hypothetical protein
LHGAVRVDDTPRPHLALAHARAGDDQDATTPPEKRWERGIGQADRHRKSTRRSALGGRLILTREIRRAFLSELYPIAAQRQDTAPSIDLEGVLTFGR